MQVHKILGFTWLWRTISLSRRFLLRVATELVSYTDKHTFYRMKTNLCFLSILPSWIQMLFELLYHPQLCVTIFKMQFWRISFFFFFGRVTDIFQIWLTQFLNILWEWKRNRNKTAGMWAQSQTAILYKSDMYWQSDVWLTVHRNSVWIRKTN